MKNTLFFLLVPHFFIGIFSDTTVVYMPLKDLVNSQGYNLEEHTLTTKDNYILKLHRMPSKKHSSKINKIPLLFVHGMGGCSENILTLGPNRALGYYLVDRGFDLWMMNARGNSYSRKHSSLDPDTDQEFWLFSWHEIGIYDIPANIDYILNKTDTKQLYYIGHSQGSTSYFVMTSELPEYNKKIKLHISFAPPVFLQENGNDLGNRISKYKDLIRQYVRLSLSFLEVLPSAIKEELRKMCIKPEMVESCSMVHGIIGGGESGLFNNSILPMIFRNAPAGMSVFQVVHYLQIFNTGNFAQYDHGPEVNKDKYNNVVPPLYNLSMSVAPVVLYYGKYDWFSSEKSVEALVNHLPNIYQVSKVAVEAFNHVDFIWAYNAKYLLYRHVYKLLRNFEKNNTVLSIN